MKNVLDKLNWRYATKVFDSSKKVSKEDLNILLDAARLSASSYGLQPYHFFVIEDSEVRSKLRKASWNQSQITDASFLLVLANKPTFDDSLGLPDEQKKSWTSDQTYITLGNLMTIAAEMEIDTCPMEGFDEAEYNEILGLNDKNLNASVVLAIGYRADDDETQHYPKVRYSREQIITHI